MSFSHPENDICLLKILEGPLLQSSELQNMNLIQSYLVLLKEMVFTLSTIDISDKAESAKAIELIGSSLCGFCEVKSAFFVIDLFFAEIVSWL